MEFPSGEKEGSIASRGLSGRVRCGDALEMVDSNRNLAIAFGRNIAPTINTRIADAPTRSGFHLRNPGLPASARGSKTEAAGTSDFTSAEMLAEGATTGRDTRS